VASRRGSFGAAGTSARRPGSGAEPFRWTVRNYQALSRRRGRIPQLPETLLFGRGTATERRWVFILLLRQLGHRRRHPRDRRHKGWDFRAQFKVRRRIQGKIRSKPASASPSPKKETRALAAPVVASASLVDNQAYLLTLLLGLPISLRGAEGVTLDEAGSWRSGRRRWPGDCQPQTAATPRYRRVAPRTASRRIDPKGGSRRCWRRRRPICRGQ